MAFPSYTITGKKWDKEWLESQVVEIERCDPAEYPDWLPMYKLLMEYTFKLEERVRELGRNFNYEFNEYSKKRFVILREER